MSVLPSAFVAELLVTFDLSLVFIAGLPHKGSTMTESIA